MTIRRDVGTTASGLTGFINARDYQPGELSAPVPLFVTRLAGYGLSRQRFSFQQMSVHYQLTMPVSGLFAAKIAQADACIASANLVPQPAPGLKN